MGIVAKNGVWALEDLGEERLGALVLGCVKNFRRRPAFHHCAQVHENDLVRHLPGEGQLVGDNNHCHALRSQVLHDLKHLANVLRVKCRGGFVEEHQLGLHGQGPGDGDALLLAAGEVLGVGVAPIAQANPVQQDLGLPR